MAAYHKRQRLLDSLARERLPLEVTTMVMEELILSSFPTLYLRHLGEINLIARDVIGSGPNREGLRSLFFNAALKHSCIRLEAVGAFLNITLMNADLILELPSSGVNELVRHLEISCDEFMPWIRTIHDRRIDVVPIMTNMKRQFTNLSTLTLMMRSNPAIMEACGGPLRYVLNTISQDRLLEFATAAMAHGPGKTFRILMVKVPWKDHPARTYEFQLGGNVDIGEAIRAGFRALVTK